MKTAEVRDLVHIGKVILNARSFKFREPRASGSDSLLLETVNRLFVLLDERRVEYLLVGDIVLLQYVDGRNSEEIQILLSPSSLDCLPELRQAPQEGDFCPGRLQGDSNRLASDE